MPSFEPLAIDWLAPLLARVQGVGGMRRGSESAEFQQRVEQLLCPPLPARQWETEVWPARLADYRPDPLDRLLGESELRWIGEEGQKVSFCFEAELDLRDASEPETAEATEGVRSLFRDPEGRYDLSALARSSEEAPSRLLARMWSAIWEGEVTSDSFAAIRRGVENGFAESQEAVASPAIRSPRRGRWRSATPLAGTWRLLPAHEPAADRIELEERNKDRVRILLDRYGILFRQLLLREAPGFRWRDVFRSLRLMELAGEVVGGCFFHGIDGLQFMSQRAFRRLADGLDESRVFWLNACDPASLCGLSLAALERPLPRRVPTTHLAYRGAELIFSSRRSGRELEFHVDPSDERISEYLAPLRHLMTRAVEPLRQVTVERINEQGARSSPYLPALRACFDVMAGPKDVTLGMRR